MNRVAKYVRVKSPSPGPSILPCSYYCQRYADGKYYCRNTYYGGGYVSIICQKARFGLKIFSYVPDLWYVIENKKN